MKLKSIQDLYVTELQDLYSAEKQITRALPKMIKKTEDETLREAFESHLEETKVQIERLEQIFEGLGASAGRHKCKAMEGILEEGQEILEADGEPHVKDAATIGAAQRVEHYEIAGYGTAATYAEMLGRTKDARLLRETLEEEKLTDEKLTAIAVQVVNPEAAESSVGAGSGRGNRRGM